MCVYKAASQVSYELFHFVALKQPDTHNDVKMAVLASILVNTVGFVLSDFKQLRK